MRDPASPIEMAKAIIRSHHEQMSYPPPFPSEPVCPQCGGRIVLGERNARCLNCKARLTVQRR